jgi:hypothetical protein
METIRATAASMDVLGDYILADSGFTVQQHRSLRTRERIGERI